MACVQRLENRTLLAAPNPLDLGTLDGTTGFRLDGVAANDFSGRRVSSAGDVNGDGFDDVIVGADSADPNGGSSGSSYVVFGRSGGFAAAINLSSLDGTTGFRLDGAVANDQSGFSVSGAGDINGDGIADLIVGARGADPGGVSAAGSSYVIFGQSHAFASVIDLSSLNGTTGFRLDGGATSDHSGYAVSGAGDVNGDGFGDLVVGAFGADPDGNSYAGSSYVVFGRSGGFASAIDMNSLDGTTGFRLDGVALNDRSGLSVSGAGDVNGDGIDDLIVGADATDLGGMSAVGSSYILFGQTGGFESVINLSTLDGTTGFRLDGVAMEDRTARSVSGAGDINGDGFDDLIVGAFGADPNGSLTAGSTYVVFGRSGGFASAINLSTLSGTTGFRLDGLFGYDQSGRSVSGAGDINGDGFDDLIIGASGADANGNYSGSSYVVFGRSGSFASVINLSTLNGTTGFRLDGALAGDRSGIWVSGAGDVNGDGFDDLIIGAFAADPNGSSSGSSYVVFGGNFTGGAETQVGGDAVDVLTANLGLFADILIGGRGNDRLNSDGGPDVLRGGEGNDILTLVDVDFSRTRRLVGGTGTDTLRLDGTGLTLDLTDIADNRITGIEQINLATGGNRLVVTPREVLRLSDSSNTLTVLGGGHDRVFVAGEGWVAQGIVNLDGTDFQQYTSGAATLNVEVGLDTTFAVINLGTLDGTTGFRLDGVTAGDRSGFSVSSAGDVNGDGFDDVIVGAHRADPNGNLSGSSYVVFGRSGGFASVINLGALDGTTGFRLDGVSADDRSGYSISSAGDVNGDGFDDLIVGAPFADPNGNLSGSSYVVFGRSGGFASVIDLSSLDGTTGFRLDGVAADDRSGYSVSSAGDVNGDGFDDLIVGADLADPNGNSYAGSSYVVFGRSGGFASVINLGALDGTTGFRLDGVADIDVSGRSVSSAGDVNGDGFDDLIVGASFADPNGSQSGSSYVVFGQSGGFASVINLGALDGTTGFRLDGAAAFDGSGRSVSSAGDVNGDGFDDLIVGAYLADPNGSSSGSSYVMFGRSGGFASVINLGALDGTSGFRLDGVAAGDRSGRSVSSAGDVNGDDFDDLIVGAYSADPNGNLSAGSSYVVFGGNFTGGPETQVGGDADDTLAAIQGAGAVDILIGARGDDTLISDGGDDVLRGGEGDDVLALIDVDFSGTRRLVGGSGIDTLRLDAAGATLDLRTIADNRITGIEQVDLSAIGTATLTLDVQEVLNISGSSNTLTVFANGDTINIGPGWTQDANQIESGVVYEVYTQGAATLRITHSQIATLPAGNGTDDVTVRQRGGFIEVLDNNAMAVLKNVPLAFASSIVVNGAAGENNRVLVDFDFGGFFEVPFGIHFFGGSRVDTLDVSGNGQPLATLTPAGGALSAGTVMTQDRDKQTEITFSGIEPLSVTGLATFGIDGALSIGGETLTVQSTAFAQTGPLTILDGGTIDLSGGGLSVGPGDLLTGEGLVFGRIFAAGGSTISATGSLTVGDVSSLAGYFSDGELYTGIHTVRIFDANDAVLGSLTVLGSGGVSGTLTASNGYLLEEGKNLAGQGTVHGEFHNDGHIEGTGSGIVFEDLVTGIGSAVNVTYNGGMSPGHSPAEIDLGGTANLGAANTLFIELGGLTPGGQFDRLSSTGTVNVDGTLDVSFIDGFVPANGDSFEIIGASTINGTFDTTNLPALPLGLEWDVVYAADSVTLNVFALATAVTDTALNQPLPNPNRSGIGTLALTFDLPVDVAAVTSLTLFNHTTGQPVDISTASLNGNGTPTISWNLSELTLPDGRYTAQIIQSEVTTTVGGPLAQAHAFEFHVLAGDLDGDGVVNFNDTVPISLNFGDTVGEYGPGDADGDGIVNFNDTVPLSLNFGESLPGLTYDFGDAPEDDTSYPTTLANNGPRHVITGNDLYLGADRDGEADGQPNSDASGDGADENGLMFDPLIAGTSVDVTLVSSGAGFVNGWVDFNADGDWDDPGEQLFVDVPVESGSNDLQITVPTGAMSGNTFARFRLTGSAGYSYFGLAPDGEVEDYLLTILEPEPDTSIDVAEETLAPVTEPGPPLDPAVILEDPADIEDAPPDHLTAIPAPTFTRFDHPLSRFSTEKPHRHRRR